MNQNITDQDIQAFLAGNVSNYPSRLSLIQATVSLLWPEGPPSDGAERVVRACLAMGTEHVLVSSLPVRGARQH